MARLDRQDGPPLPPSPQHRPTMIERQQIAEALSRLDPHDREILDYSLRRRVPDEDLAALFDAEPAEVARRRAAAIEALSGDLGAQRGADLGHILKELLEGETWDAAAAAAPASEPGEPSPPPRAPEPEPEEPASDHPPLGASSKKSPEEPADAGRPEGERVLGMLSGDQEPAAAPAEPEPEAPSRKRSRRRLLVGVAAAAAVLVPAGMVAALATSEDSDSGPSGSASSATREFAPAREGGAGSAEPFPSDPQSAEQYPIARVNKRTALYREPGGKVRLRVTPKTEWDSPRILSVVERRGRWLAVLVPELKNGQHAWVRDDKVANISSVTWALHADLSKRTIEVRHNGKTVRTMKIGVGRTDHPTPVGRYAVTDKLRVSDPGSPYGCCVLALTGHQTRLPAGWPGGDRLAVHATRDLSGLGKRVSLGCMRTDPRDTKWMMKRVPLGTPVFVDS